MSRAYLQDKQRVVIKIGTSTITHTDTGHLNLVKLEKFVRILTDIHNQNKELIIVSSGAIGAGRNLDIGKAKGADCAGGCQARHRGLRPHCQSGWTSGFTRIFGAAGCDWL